MDIPDVASVKITLPDILEYLGKGNRPLIEGDKLYKGKHVISASVTRKTEKLTQITGLVLQTSQPKAYPHEVEIKIYERSNTKWQCSCSCKAGLGHKCKHVFAMLIHLHHCDQLNIATCTDVRQSWGKYKKTVEKQFSAKRVSEMCLVVSAPPKIIPTAQQDMDNLNGFTKAAPKSALALHAQKRHSMCGLRKFDLVNVPTIIAKMFDDWPVIFATILPLEERNMKDFYLRTVSVGQAQIEKIERSTRLQNNAVWMSERALRITASRAHELYTYKGQNWNLKMEKFLSPSQYKSVAMLYGTKTEMSARKCYEATTKDRIQSVGLVINVNQPWLGCSPDGYIVEKDKLVEIKCPFNGKSMSLTDMLCTLRYLDENLHMKKNHIYYTQVQIAMAVTNVKCCDFVIYSKFDNKCHISTIYLDIERVQNILNKLQNVYFVELLPKLFEKNKAYVT